jgi:hypothetical protein
VRKGKALMRPFPQIPMLTTEELAFVPKGPTTFPANNDVMFGTRYDAKFMGQYEYYLNWHKGNKPYLQAIREYGPLYETYQRLPSAFDQQLVQGVVEVVTQTNGRFLEQDYRTGSWHVLSPEDIEWYIRRDLAYAASPDKMALRQVLRRLIALGRFGFGRESMMFRKSVVYLHLLEQKLVGSTTGNMASTKALPRAVNLIGGPRGFVSTTLRRHPDAAWVHTPAHCRMPYSSIRDGMEVEPFPIGSTVYIEEEGLYNTVNWYRGEVMEISPDKSTFTVALEYGDTEDNIPRSHIHRYEPMTAGDHVVACFERRFQDCFEGTVLYVAPDSTLNILFDDGEFLRHPGEAAYKPPFKYLPPER